MKTRGPIVALLAALATAGAAPSARTLVPSDLDRIAPGRSKTADVRARLGPPAREWRDWVAPGEIDPLAIPSEPGEVREIERKSGGRAVPLVAWEYPFDDPGDAERPVLIVFLHDGVVRSVHRPLAVRDAGEPAALAGRLKQTPQRVLRTVRIGHVVQELEIDWFPSAGRAFVRFADRDAPLWEVRLPADGSVQP